MSFNFAYGPVDVFQGLDMDAFLKRMQSSALPEKSEAEMKAGQMLAGGGTAAGGGTIPPIMAPSPEVISGIIPDPNAGSASGVMPDRNPDGSPMVVYPEMYDRPPMQGDPGYDPTPGPGYVQPSLFMDSSSDPFQSGMDIEDYIAGIAALQPSVYPISGNRDDDLLLRMRQSSPLPERSEPRMKAQQMIPQRAPTPEAVTTAGSSSSGSSSSGSDSSGSRGIPSLAQMVFERYQPLVSQQRSYKSYIG